MLLVVDLILATKFIITLTMANEVVSSSSFGGLFHLGQSLRLMHDNLPAVFILPFDCGNADGHSESSIFFNWLNTIYDNTMISSDEADFFYIPCAEKTFDLEQKIGLFTELENVTMSLDRTFMIPSIGSQWDHARLSQYDHLDSVRLLQTQNDVFSNGRDVFIPRLEPPTLYDNNHHTLVTTSRKTFIFAYCEDDKSSSRRTWGGKLLQAWAQAPNSTFIARTLSDTEFTSSLKASDFCVVLPTNVSISRVLYRSIFAGCIPVVFVSYRGQLPFVNFVDWDLFSVVVLKDILNSPVGMGELLRHLTALRLNDKKFATLKHSLLKVQGLFNWSRTEWPSVYHLSLLELRHTDSCKHKGRNVFNSKPGDVLHKLGC